MKRYLALAILLLMAVPAFAEDGELFVKNISKTPDLETDHATLRVLYKNVPAMTSSGELTTVDYIDKASAVVDTRSNVQPLIAFYHDGHVTYPEDCAAFPGHGNRDVFGAVSLDDGNTWNTTNLSKSGDKSSFRLKDGSDYPGDTFRLFANSAGNKVLVAWASRFATGGNPNYAMSDEDRVTLAAYLGITVADLYLKDMWGVAGSQRSSDFADEDFPTVGEIPYASLWTARGTLEDTDNDGDYEMVWRKAERLTSARRDVHRIEVGVAGGAGFVLTWQEDPDGLRPGHGEGPGEGWSGAVAHHETDIWYSYIDWDNFDLVDDAADGLNPILLTAYDLENDGTPSVGIPFSMPVRLTDNAMCQMMSQDYDPIEEPSYCYEVDTDGNNIADFCASTVQVSTVPPPEAPDQTVDILDLCVTENGRLMRGNTASTRNRVNLRGYDTDGDGDFDSAWVVMAYEESKGMGEEEDLDPQELIEKTDMGKNIWYHTFDMFNPELVSQGMMLNMPAVYPEGTPFDYNSATSRLKEYTYTTSDNKYTYRFMQIDPDPVYKDQANLDTTLFQSEIARRFSLISQPATDVGFSGTVALAMWKQGIIRQGGPADVMARRFAKPAVFDPTTDNPFDYNNMECSDWLFTDESNPRYIKGLCVSTPKNMSGTSLVESNDKGASNSVNATVAQLVYAFPWNQAYDDIDMGELDSYEEMNLDSLPKIYQWSQSGPNYGDDVVAMDPALTNFDDQSWENPYDVAKGHRGYISGDYIMMLYCWSPNWLANTRGHDNYNLYVRRSFDGGQTWTTLPANWTDTQPMPLTADGVTRKELTADGTIFYEWMGPAGGETEYKVEYDLGPGIFEPVRNMSLLTGIKLTVLDPRYAPTGGATHSSIKNDDGSFMYPDDERDPSKWFITFEVGDNTTVAEGEATPLDMFYSRATNYGDDFEYVPQIVVNPDTENEFYFDWLEGKKDIHAAEAAMSGNPGGTFFWTIWNQWQEDINGDMYDSDAILRRLMFSDEEVETTPSGGGGGGSGGGASTPPTGGGRRK
jgi:hypothetical protein